MAIQQKIKIKVVEAHNALLFVLNGGDYCMYMLQDWGNKDEYQTGEMQEMLLGDRNDTFGRSDVCRIQ